MNVTREVVGIVLVRNEDRHIEAAVTNIVEFCDRIVIADHGSTDDTPEIVARLAARHRHIQSHRVGTPRESHDLIASYAGTNTWIFGVDGDEIYDPNGLSKLRAELLARSYQDRWMILGNVLNCDLLDPARKIAGGYLAPPCRSITKLYNFRAIRSWTGDTPERLHGGNIEFQPGWDASARHNLHEQRSWEESPLRCLHACFVPRSTLDGADDAARENIMDLHTAGPLARVNRWWKMLRRAPLESDWKKSRYRRGKRVQIDARAFFP